MLQKFEDGSEGIADEALRGQDCPKVSTEGIWGHQDSPIWIFFVLLFGGKFKVKNVLFYLTELPLGQQKQSQ